MSFVNPFAKEVAAAPGPDPSSNDVVFSFAELGLKPGTEGQRVIMRNPSTLKDACHWRYSTILPLTDPGIWVFDGFCDPAQLTQTMLPIVDRLDPSRTAFDNNPLWQYEGGGLLLQPQSPTVSPSRHALQGVKIATGDIDWSKVQAISGAAEWRGSVADLTVALQVGRNNGDGNGQIAAGLQFRTNPPTAASPYFQAYWFDGRWAGDKSLGIGTSVTTPPLQENSYVGQSFFFEKSWSTNGVSQFTTLRNSIEARAQSASPGDPIANGYSAGGFDELNFYCDSGVGGSSFSNSVYLRSFSLRIREYQPERPYWPS